MSGRHARQKGAQRVSETSELVAWMQRLMVVYGDRVAQDPAALVHFYELGQYLTDQANRGIFEANRDQDHYSQNEIAAILGKTRQAIAKRIGLGEEVYAEIQRQRGAGAVVRIGDVRRSRAELLEAAGVDDKTGSVRELGARTA